MNMPGYIKLKSVVEKDGVMYGEPADEKIKTAVCAVNKKENKEEVANHIAKFLLEQKALSCEKVESLYNGKFYYKYKLTVIIP
jgi:hypothetical protein